MGGCGCELAASQRCGIMARIANLSKITKIVWVLTDGKEV